MTAPAREFHRLGSVVLIGGGDLMLHAARAFGQRLPCFAILAPRHAEEALPLDGRSTRQAFTDAGIRSVVVADMDRDPSWRSLVAERDSTLALCFGPAWIFSAEVRQAFGLGMLNFNGIPVPHYLGGAHYSWQILNDDRSGGCILQDITGDLDRGDILRAEHFQLPPSVTVPLDYFHANHERGVVFIDQLVADLLSGVSFVPRPLSELDSRRLYFPRLLTSENAFIDWSWGAGDVVRFCHAFDRPYAGAGTFLGERLLRLRDVSLAEDRVTLHPFTAGLVVRRHDNAAYVAARGGVLRFGIVVDGKSGSSCLGDLREGMRLHTGAERLEQARLFRPKLGGATSLPDTARSADQPTNRRGP